MPKLKPLCQWICDTCGKIIDEPGQGMLMWLGGQGPEDDHGFKIVHNLAWSPLDQDRDGCYYPGGLFNDMHLDLYVGEDGLVLLLAMLDPGRVVSPDYGGPMVRDVREWVEVIRRLQVPYYEEGRLYFDRALNDGTFDGANEVSPYLGLRRLIEGYEEEDGEG